MDKFSRDEDELPEALTFERLIFDSRFLHESVGIAERDMYLMHGARLDVFESRARTLVLTLTRRIIEGEIVEESTEELDSVNVPATWCQHILHRFLPKRFARARGRIRYRNITVKTVHTTKYSNVCPHMEAQEDHVSFLVAGAKETFAEMHGAKYAACLGSVTGTFDILKMPNRQVAMDAVDRHGAGFAAMIIYEPKEE